MAATPECFEPKRYGHLDPLVWLRPFLFLYTQYRARGCLEVRPISIRSLWQDFHCHRLWTKHSKYYGFEEHPSSAV